MNGMENPKGAEEGMTPGQLQLLADDAALLADNEAAAREEAERSRPPVVPLGKEAGRCVLYSMEGREIHRLPADKLTWPNMLDMAPRKAWQRWLYPDRAEDDMPGKRELVEAAQERLLDACRGRVFDPACIRARGIWQDSETGGTVYNAGDACYLTPPGGSPTRVDNVRGGCVYAAGVSLPSPLGYPLSIPEGRRVMEFLQARAWAVEGSGVLAAGWIVASLLAGVLPCRPHLWINAPAGTGKTVLKEDMAAMLGKLAIEFEGAGTTEAAIRQTIDCAALPVLADEVEAGDNDAAGHNIAAWLELMRSAFKGNVALSKGSKEGTARVYLIRCCFALFSISNVLDRDADISRCLVLSLRRMPGKEAREALWRRQDAGRALVQGRGFNGRLLARLLPMVPGILANVSALAAHLSQYADARRAELFATLLACAYALTHDGAMTPDGREHAAAIMRAYAEQEEKESDMSRCLSTLLAYRLNVANGIGAASVRAICQLMHGGSNAETLDACARALYSAGMAWQGDKGVLRVDTSKAYMQPIFKGTQWQNGRIVPVLADECPGKGKPNGQGICYTTYRQGVAVKNCLLLPAGLILDD